MYHHERFLGPEIPALAAPQWGQSGRDTQRLRREGGAVAAAAEAALLYGIPNIGTDPRLTSG